MAVEVLTHVYTSQAEIERLFSVEGIESVTSDLFGDNRATFWTEIIEYATDYVNGFLWLYHEEADLADSRWVRSRTTVVGAYLVSQRRGQTALFQDLFDLTTDELERVNETRPVPRLATRSDFSPAMSNIVIDDRFRVAKIRVHSTISTGGVSSKQNLSPVFPFEWL